MPSEHSASWTAFQVAARSFVPHLGGPSWLETPSPQQSLNANNHTKWMHRLPINNLQGYIFSLHILLMTSRGATRQYNSYSLRAGVASQCPTKTVEVFVIGPLGWSLVAGFSVNVPIAYFLLMRFCIIYGLKMFSLCGEECMKCYKVWLDSKTQMLNRFRILSPGIPQRLRPSFKETLQVSYNKSAKSKL